MRKCVSDGLFLLRFFKKSIYQSIYQLAHSEHVLACVLGGLFLLRDFKKSIYLSIYQLAQLTWNTGAPQCACVFRVGWAFFIARFQKVYTHSAYAHVFS